MAPGGRAVSSLLSFPITGRVNGFLILEAPVLTRDGFSPSQETQMSFICGGIPTCISRSRYPPQTADHPSTCAQDSSTSTRTQHHQPTCADVMSFFPHLLLGPDAPSQHRQSSPPSGASPSPGIRLGFSPSPEPTSNLTANLQGPPFLPLTWSTAECDSWSSGSACSWQSVLHPAVRVILSDPEKIPAPQGESQLPGSVPLDPPVCSCPYLSGFCSALLSFLASGLSSSSVW